MPCSRRIGLGRGQHECDAQPRDARSGGRHPRVIGLHGSGCDHVRRALAARVANQELELPRLVATERQPGQIVALQQNARASAAPAKRPAKARCFGERGRQRGKAEAR